MPQENIMANARLETRKKLGVRKHFLLLSFHFCSFDFSCFKSRAILYTFCILSVVLQEGIHTK